MISYISNLAIPFTILIIISYALLEKKKVFEIFIKGATEGMKIVVKIFPTLIGLFLAIGILRSSGIMIFFVRLLFPITELIDFPSEIIPLALIRPISRKCFHSNRNRYNENLWSR